MTPRARLNAPADFGLTVQQARLEAGHSQAELAERLLSGEAAGRPLTLGNRHMARWKQMSDLPDIRGKSGKADKFHMSA